jgi:hypothetical protein
MGLTGISSASVRRSAQLPLGLFPPPPTLPHSLPSGDDDFIGLAGSAFAFALTGNVFGMASVGLGLALAATPTGAAPALTSAGLPGFPAGDAPALTSAGRPPFGAAPDFTNAGLPLFAATAGVPTGEPPALTNAGLPGFVATAGVPFGDAPALTSAGRPPFGAAPDLTNAGLPFGEAPDLTNAGRPLIDASCVFSSYRKADDAPASRCPACPAMSVFRSYVLHQPTQQNQTCVIHMGLRGDGSTQRSRTSNVNEFSGRRCRAALSLPQADAEESWPGDDGSWTPPSYAFSACATSSAPVC